MMMMLVDEGEYDCSAIGGGAAAELQDPAAFEYTVPPPQKKKKMKKCKNNKRRFSEEQIRSLEGMFENETKLEPRKKVQLARELGLQPRQVAIWFQNKRARWKSKQLQRDYALLLSSYNNLASHFESLKKEKQSLLQQLQKLNVMIGNKSNHQVSCGPNNEDHKSKVCREEFASLSVEGSEHGINSVLSDDDSSMRADYLGLDEESKLLNMVEPADSSLTSPENWPASLDSEGPAANHQWWDFWS